MLDRQLVWKKYVSAVFSLTSSRTPRLAFALSEEQVAALRVVLGYSDEI